MKKLQRFFFAGIFSLSFFACKKDTFITSPNARLSLSADTIKFDTVFTTVGSISQSFKIFNNNDQKLLLSKIKLMGNNSSFKININGLAAPEASNIEIPSNDSIYIFVTVSVIPSAANLPFILTDSILVSYNGNDRYVQLQAYGQNAHFISNESISANTTWPNDLPYVILGGLRINNNKSLTIEAGCRIYLHANSPLLVDGTIIINGVKGNEVQFTGDRLDEPYRYFPSSWPGIYFNEQSKDNQITYAIIKNASRGIVVTGPSSNANAKLIIHQSIIDNITEAGLLCTNTSLQADNTLISNCGKNIDIRLGGNYAFTNCTVASYSNSYILHKMPVLVVSNSTDQNGTSVSADIDASFKNCIFWAEDGIVGDEIILNKQGVNLYNINIDHCLYKALNDPANATLTSVIKNLDPVFDSIDVNHNYYDFRTTKDPFAPGIDQGSNVTFIKDLDNNNRTVGLPDLGCYEKQ